MAYSVRCVLTLSFCAVVCLLTRPAWSAVMTFDALAPDFSEISSYTEDGITFVAVNGPPDHFHPNDNFDNGTTGADLFGDDGNPFRITAASGGLFDLISVYVFDIDTGSGPMVFTTAGGAIHNVSSTGLITFGSAFGGVNFVQIDIPGGAVGRFIGLDNITVTPEPSTFVFALIGMVSLLGAKWRKATRPWRSSCNTSATIRAHIPRRNSFPDGDYQ